MYVLATQRWHKCKCSKRRRSIFVPRWETFDINQVWKCENQNLVQVGHKCQERWMESFFIGDERKQLIWWINRWICWKMKLTLINFEFIKAKCTSPVHPTLKRLWRPPKFVPEGAVIAWTGNKIIYHLPWCSSPRLASIYSVSPGWWYLWRRYLCEHHWDFRLFSPARFLAYHGL